MADTLVSDGKAVEVVLTGTTEKGTPVLLDGFHGITMEDGTSGETVAIEIAQREHEIVVGASITAAKGDILYIQTNGTVNNTASGRAFMRVTVAKDANNVVWGILLPQGAESV